MAGAVTLDDVPARDLASAPVFPGSGASGEKDATAVVCLAK